MNSDEAMKPPLSGEQWKKACELQIQNLCPSFLPDGPNADEQQWAYGLMDAYTAVVELTEDRARELLNAL